MTTKKVPVLLAMLLVLAANLSSFAQNINIVKRSSMTFPGQTLANVCGYAANGREYALLGASLGMIIVDVTNPDVPVKITQITGPNNLWKEIKTYKNYAYVVSEGGQGLQIVDLTNLPAANLTNHFYKGNGAIAGELNTIHALHIDETKGFLYLYGTNLFAGGPVVVDLNADPYNPTYAGKFDQLGYVHDGYVDNDTMYAGHIGAGFFSVVNMADKSNPELLAIQPTPNTFTHNTWISSDRKTIFTTDEVDGSFLGAYDVSDPSDIKFLDKIQMTAGSQSIGHNTHVLGNYAITSWYTEGVSIVDVSQPDNLVRVGNYDTWPAGNGGGFEGCWGVYPYLPSGNLIASNIPSTGGGTGEMFVLTPSYKRACYLEGKITDAVTGAAVSGAKIQFSGAIAADFEYSGLEGNYKTGRAQAGLAQIVVSKPGYLPEVGSVDLVTGQVAVFNKALTPVATYAITGNAISSVDGSPVPFAQIAAFGPDSIFHGTADANGVFNLTGIFPGEYDLVAGAWGYEYAQKFNQNINANQSVTLELPKGYRDDFVFDYGWEASGTSVTGQWERGEPIGVNPGILLVPETDFGTDIGNACYTTGNTSAQPGGDCVDAGTAVLLSPVMDLSGYSDPSVKAVIFYTNFTQSGPVGDTLKIYISNGLEEKLIGFYLGGDLFWHPFSKKIKQYLPLTNNMRLKVVANDDPLFADFNSNEVTFDYFRVTDAPVATEQLADAVKLQVLPNPFKDEAVIDYTLPETGFTLAVFDLLGKQVQTSILPNETGLVTVGKGLKSGVYFARLQKDGQVYKTVKLVKAN